MTAPEPSPHASLSVTVGQLRLVGLNCHVASTAARETLVVFNMASGEHAATYAYRPDMEALEKVSGKSAWPAAILVIIMAPNLSAAGILRMIARAVIMDGAPEPAMDAIEDDDGTP